MLRMMRDPREDGGIVRIALADRVRRGPAWLASWIIVAPCSDAVFEGEDNLM
jgi:hypothetical protein